VLAATNAIVWILFMSDSYERCPTEKRHQGTLVPDGTGFSRAATFVA